MARSRDNAHRDVQDSTSELSQRRPNAANLTNKVGRLFYGLSITSPPSTVTEATGPAASPHIFIQDNAMPVSGMRASGRNEHKLLTTDHQRPTSEVAKGTRATNKAFPIMDLPPEIRLIIYEFALVLDHPIEFWPIAPELDWIKEDASLSFRLRQGVREVAVELAVGLLRVSKQINSEVTGILYGMNAFHFSGKYGFVVLEAFLYTIGSTNRKNVADVRVCSPSYPDPTRRTRDRIKRMLRQMHLHTPIQDHQVKRYYGSKDPCPAEWEHLAFEDLSRVIEKDGTLRSLSIRCETYSDHFPDKLGVLRHMAPKVSKLRVSLIFPLVYFEIKDYLDQKDRISRHAAYIRSGGFARHAAQEGWEIWVRVYHVPNEVCERMQVKEE